VVWVESQDAAVNDPFTEEENLLLKGIDTRDGLGERALVSQPANYTRPILSTDGETILFTRVGIKRKRDKGGKMISKERIIDLYRTDWKGTPPVRITEGYVASAWRDPATKEEWIYFTRNFKGRGNGFVARELCRFLLKDPNVQEVVFDGSLISPSDNIQLSRDGRYACALLPWPKACAIDLDASPPTVRQLGNGCWPSMAPDESGLAWVFRGDHLGGTFSTAKNDFREVRFDAPCAKIGETYHPRWTNHARFMVLTGPYVPEKPGAMAIPSEGNHPDVFLGKFNETANQFEGWVQVSAPGLPKAAPDAWIEGGEKSSLHLAP